MARYTSKPQRHPLATAARPLSPADIAWRNDAAKFLRDLASDIKPVSSGVPIPVPGVVAAGAYDAVRNIGLTRVLPAIAPAKTPVGRVIRDATRIGVGALPAYRAVRGLGVPVGKIANAAAIKLSKTVTRDREKKPAKLTPQERKARVDELFTQLKSLGPFGEVVIGAMVSSTETMADAAVNFPENGYEVMERVIDRLDGFTRVGRDLARSDANLLAAVKQFTEQRRQRPLRVRTDAAGRILGRGP